MNIAPSDVIKHVVADLEGIRALLTYEANKNRDWRQDEDIAEIGQEKIDEVVIRLDRNIRALCHAIDPNRHSISTRKEATGTAFELNTRYSTGSFPRLVRTLTFLKIPAGRIRWFARRPDTTPILTE